jgi:hypothetical protein
MVLNNNNNKDGAELTSILWREKRTLISAFCSSGTRTKVDVTKCGHGLTSRPEILEFFSKNPHHCVGLVREVDPSPTPPLRSKLIPVFLI